MSTQLIWPLIILQIATIIAIVLFLRMILHKQLEVGIKRIKRLDEENLKKEAELNERLKNIDKEYNMKMNEARKEADTMLENAKEELKKMQEAERIKAKEESKRIIESALQERDKMMKQLDDEILERAIDLSQNILKKVFSEEDLKSLRIRISKEVIDFLTENKEISELLKKNKTLEVITADPLSESDKKYILRVLGEKIQTKIDTTFSIDKNLLGGLILKVGERIIDGSIVYRISKAALAMKEELR